MDFMQNPKFKTRIESWPQDTIRPYGERLAVFSEAKRKNVRWKLLNVKDRNPIEKDISSLTFNGNIFYKVTKDKEQENVFTVIDKISSSDFDQKDVEDPINDYWCYQINKDGKIISTIYSSMQQEELPYKISNVLDSSYAYYRSLRVEELFNAFSNRKPIRSLNKL